MSFTLFSLYPLYSLLPVSSIFFSMYIVLPSPYIIYNFLPVSSTLFSLYPLLSSPCILNFLLPVSSTSFSLHPLFSFTCILYSLLPVSSTLFSQYHPTLSLFSQSLPNLVPVPSILLSQNDPKIIPIVSRRSNWQNTAGFFRKSVHILICSAVSSTLFSQYHPTCSLYPLLFSPNIIQPSSDILYSFLPISSNLFPALYSFLPISSNLFPVYFTLFSQYHPTCSLYPLLFSPNIIQPFLCIL